MAAMMNAMNAMGAMGQPGGIGGAGGTTTSPQTLQPMGPDAWLVTMEFHEVPEISRSLYGTLDAVQLISSMLRTRAWSGV